VRSDKIGWNTNPVSREQLISGLDEALRQPSIWVHDPTTIQELHLFIINLRGRAEAQAGCQDDCVIALALPVVVLARRPRRDRRRNPGSDITASEARPSHRPEPY
jgi:hypothetical protein